MALEEVPWQRHRRRVISKYWWWMCVNVQSGWQVQQLLRSLTYNLDSDVRQLFLTTESYSIVCRSHHFTFRVTLRVPAEWHLCCFRFLAPEYKAAGSRKRNWASITDSKGWFGFLTGLSDMSGLPEDTLPFDYVANPVCGLLNFQLENLTYALSDNSLQNIVFTKVCWNGYFSFPPHF